MPTADEQARLVEAISKVIQPALEGQPPEISIWFAEPHATRRSPSAPAPVTPVLIRTDRKSGIS